MSELTFPDVLEEFKSKVREINLNRQKCIQTLKDRHAIFIKEYTQILEEKYRNDNTKQQVDQLSQAIVQAIVRLSIRIHHQLLIRHFPDSRAVRRSDSPGNSTGSATNVKYHILIRIRSPY